MGEYDTFPNFWAFLHRVFSSAKWGNMILFFIFGLFSLYFLEICFKILKISQGLPLWQLSCLCWARLGWRFQIQYSDELDSQKSEWGWIKLQNMKSWRSCEFKLSLPLDKVECPSNEAVRQNLIGCQITPNASIPFILQIFHLFCKYSIYFANIPVIGKIYHLFCKYSLFHIYKRWSGCDPAQGKEVNRCSCLHLTITQHVV